MELTSSEILSSLVVLVILGLASPLAAQQPQGTKTPTRTDWFPASPVGSQSSGAPATQTEMEPMPLVAPIFFEDGETTSSLVIANSTAMAAGATIAVRSLSGSEVGTIHKKLGPHEHQEIPLQSLLAYLGKPLGTGSITVTQDANLKGMAIAAQLLLTRIKASLPSYVDEEFVMPSLSGSAILRGVADEAAGTALIAITSLVNWEQHVHLICLSEQAEHKPAEVTIAPYATSVVSSCSGELFAGMDSYTQSLSQNQAGEIQGYELVTDGGTGAMSAFGLAPHFRNEDLVFSSILFMDPAEIHSPNSVFAGVPFGTQDALPNGVYKPRISFANFATTPAHVTISIATTQTGGILVSAEPGDSPEKVTIRQLTIAPRRSAELELGDTVSQRGLLQSLFVETDKKPSEVLGKAVSRSKGSLYEVELLQKDERDENNSGIHPWSVEGDFESHLLFFNHGKTPQVFGVGIASDSTLWDKKYTLAPNETREISISELIQDKVPDEKGRILGANLERGVVNWMVPDSGNATGRLMVTSRSKGMARNFSCGYYSIVCGLSMDLYDNGFIAVGTTDDLWNAVPGFCLNWAPGMCNGGTQVSSGSASYNWTIGATSIITATSSSQLTYQSPTVRGVSHGSGSGYVNVEGGGCQSGGSEPGNVCIAPTSETSAVVGRYLVTVTAFRQTVSDSQGDNLNGLGVKESTVSPGSDGCYYSGAPFGPTSSVTGGAWTIGGSDPNAISSNGTNQWGTDLDGFTTSAISGIRAHVSLPCVDHTPQTMLSQMSCNAAYAYPYSFNTQTVTVNASTVVNCRAGICDTVNY